MFDCPLEDYNFYSFPPKLEDPNTIFHALLLFVSWQLGFTAATVDSSHLHSKNSDNRVNFRLIKRMLGLPLSLLHWS